MSRPSSWRTVIEARKNKDWAKADELRAQLEALGWTVEDSAQGTKVSR